MATVTVFTAERMQEIEDKMAIVPVLTVTTTAYTLGLTDLGKLIRAAFVGASSFTVPDNAAVPFLIGTYFRLYAAGGELTVVPAAGVTIRNNAAPVPQYGEVRLRKDGVNEWVRSG